MLFTLLPDTSRPWPTTSTVGHRAPRSSGRDGREAATTVLAGGFAGVAAPSCLTSGRSLPETEAEVWTSGEGYHRQAGLHQL